jgi:hypothetical protein
MSDSDTTLRSGSGWCAAALHEIPGVPTATDPGDPDWKALSHWLGIGAFGLNAYVAHAAGDELAAEHDEAGSGHEEVYLVLAGRVRFNVGGETFDAGPGQVVAVRDPSVTRSAEALEPGATLLGVGCRAGCFETSWSPRHFEQLGRHPALDA